jgi:hypothetical protein
MARDHTSVSRVGVTGDSFDDLATKAGERKSQVPPPRVVGGLESCEGVGWTRFAEEKSE